MADLANPIKAGMSWGEFLAAGEEWQRWELVDGQVEFMSPAGTRHGRVMWKLIPKLEAYCTTYSGWIGLGPDTAFTLAIGTWRCPDAALVRAERKLPDGPSDFPLTLHSRSPLRATPRDAWLSKGASTKRTA